VHPFFYNNLNSGAYIVSKELNQGQELFKSFYRISTESVSLLMDLVGAQIRRQNTNFRTAVSRTTGLITVLVFIFDIRLEDKSF
jgi:hypothetical protein